MIQTQRQKMTPKNSVMDYHLWVLRCGVKKNRESNLCIGVCVCVCASLKVGAQS